jgi:hypothetical protein
MNDKTRASRIRDQFDAWMRDTIAAHGWALQAVLGDDDAGPYCYTIGLSGYDRHPELMVVGLGQDEAASLLNQLGEQVRRGTRLEAGDVTVRMTPPGSTVPVDLAFTLVDVDPAVSAELLLGANRWYRERDGPPIQALEVLWTGRDVPRPGEVA